MCGPLSLVGVNFLPRHNGSVVSTKVGGRTAQDPMASDNALRDEGIDVAHDDLSGAKLGF